MEGLTIANTCAALNCDKEAKLRCPECLKLKIKDNSYFCGKECFKSSWATHKQVHEECNI